MKGDVLKILNAQKAIGIAAKYWESQDIWYFRKLPIASHTTELEWSKFCSPHPFWEFHDFMIFMRVIDEKETAELLLLTIKHFFIMMEVKKSSDFFFYTY